MGACSILPRLIGQGRAAELLYTGRVMTPEEGDKWGFYNMKNLIGFDHIKYIQGIPKFLIEKRVLNPDGDDMWGYKMNENTFFIPTIIVDNTNSIFPIGMKILLKDDVLQFVKMDAIRNIQWYQNILQGVGQKYHPNEIMACICL